jgi:hypothetical protein
MGAKGLVVFIIYIARQNYLLCFDALNLIEFVMYQQGMAVFTKISSFY